MTNLPMQTTQQQTPAQHRPSGSPKSIASASWIAGRVKVLLSHFYDPKAPADVQDAALVDWVATLDGMRQDLIEQACEWYLRNKTVRPRPAEIRAIVLSYVKREAEAEYRRQPVQVVAIGQAKDDRPPVTEEQKQRAYEVLQQAGYTQAR